MGEVRNTWWKDVNTFKKEDVKHDDQRVRSLVTMLLQHPSPCLGIVAHSLLFQRINQLFWPNNPALREELRAGMRNGAAPDTLDPLHDKIVNAGVLVLTWRYQDAERAK